MDIINTCKWIFIHLFLRERKSEREKASFVLRWVIWGRVIFNLGVMIIGSKVCEFWLQCNSMAIIGIFTQVNDKVAVVYRLEWSMITTRKMPPNLRRSRQISSLAANNIVRICRQNAFFRVSRSSPSLCILSSCIAIHISVFEKIRRGGSKLSWYKEFCKMKWHLRKKRSFASFDWVLRMKI